MTSEPSSTPGMHAADMPTVTMIVGDSQIDRRVLDQARTLTQAGCRVTVLAGPGTQTGAATDEASYPDLMIVRIDPSRPVESYSTDDERLPEGLRRSWGQIFDHHDYFLELALEFEANIYTAHDLPQLPAAAIAAATAGSYLVYDAHELFPERQFFPPKTVSFLQEVERAVVPLADRIITVNKSIAEVMAVRYDIDVPDVVLNCPAVHDDDRVVESGNALREALGLADDVRILLYQGGLHDHRNLRNLVSAMSHVQTEDVVLVLMGDGGLRDPLQQIATQAGLLNRKIFFAEPVPQRDLLRFTASADAGIIPYPHVDLNTYFCTPNKLFEFLVAGLPILANDSPELNRFVSGQGAGLNVPMRSPEQLSEAIDAFFAGELDGWRAKARSLSERYTWAKESEAFLQAYESLGSSYPKAGLRQTVLGANADFQHGRTEIAFEKLEQVLDIDPDNVGALNLMSDIAYSECNMQAALQLAKEVLTRDSENAIALRRVSQVQEYAQNMELLSSL